MSIYFFTFYFLYSLKLQILFKNYHISIIIIYKYLRTEIINFKINIINLSGQHGIKEL